MTNQHRATPELWATAERWGQNSMDMANCILELRARVEALEAGATCPHIATSDEGTSYCRLAKQTQDKLDRLIELDRAKPAPAGSLVERVAARVEYGIDANQDPEGIARAAIRQVAAWFVTITPRNHTTRALWRTASDVLHDEASR
jgi:hypothetical protein